MNRNIRLTIEYDGTNFNGWQIQRKGQRTVQREIERALKKILKEKIRLTGSGRTDSGVHALGQVGHFLTNSKMPVTKMVKALNANLPSDVAIVDAQNVPVNFHAQYSVKSKAYRYTILYRQSRSALQSRYCLHYPYRLNIALMRQEASSLVGRKNFKSFQGTDAAKRQRQNKENTIRTVKNILIRRSGDYIYIDIEANGFLYKMVRNIVGTLLEVGRGKLSRGSVKSILAKKNRQAAGHTVKAQGLCLLQVKY